MKTSLLFGFVRQKGGKLKFRSFQRAIIALDTKKSPEWIKSYECIALPQPTFRLSTMLQVLRRVTNAKPIGKDTRKVHVDEGGAKRFLDNLERGLLENHSYDSIKNIVRHRKPVLTVLTNANTEPKLRDPGETLDFFGERVILRFVKVSEITALGNLLDRNDRTRILLAEFEKQFT